MTWLPAAIPDALLFACFGFVVALAALGIVVCWLGRYVRAGAVALWRRAGGLWWPSVTSRSAVELHGRHPAPERLPARADLDAAHPVLAAQVRHLHQTIDSKAADKTAPSVPLRPPTRSQIRRLIRDARRACRDAANHTP